MNSSFRTHIAALDAELTEIVSEFLLLTPLSWPRKAMRQFLSAYEKDKLVMPQVEYSKADYAGQIRALKKFLAKLGVSDEPVLGFLRDTAESYLHAYYILQGVGSNAVTEYSELLYGSPGDELLGYGRSNVDVAEFFIRVVDDYELVLDEEPVCYSAAQFKRLLQRQIKQSLGAGLIDVAVDEDISARATAGPNYVKVRKGARFSENDLEQLFHHEVMIHVLTYINGRAQPVLSTLGCNAPRTTATQEGLAVFAEYISSSLALERLKRIALRILAIDKAEQGADFIELFSFFKDQGQSAEESYYSAMRIFRGGDPRGGIIFYKDNVYLRGLLEVSAFLKRAMHEGFIHDIALLFCGKLTTGDVVKLKDAAEQGIIVDPIHIPRWAKASSELAAHLAINDLAEQFKRGAPNT